MNQDEKSGARCGPASKKETRDSVWSIRRKYADTFFATLFTLWIVMATVVSAMYLDDSSRPATMGTAEWVARTALEILPRLGEATIPVVMTAMILSRPMTAAGGAVVITYDALRERFVLQYRRKQQAIGRAEGLAQGKAEGLTEGRALGLAEGKAQGIAQGEIRANQQSSEWWRNYQNAQAAGLPFDDPPPFVS